MDAVQKANSGHPGTPMAMAPVAYTLWQEFLRYDPADAHLAQPRPFRPLDRPRLDAPVLADPPVRVKAVGKDDQSSDEPPLTLDDLKKFRQIDSKTPGHPEYRWTTGVETTTGPLGQGVATSVGMASAGLWLAHHYNKPDFDPLRLRRLRRLRRRRHDGRGLVRGRQPRRPPQAAQPLLDLRQQPDHHRRLDRDHLHRGHRRPVPGLRLERPRTSMDANDTEAIAEAFELFKKEQHRPTFIVVHSHIGYGSSKQDTSKAHGSPLGADVIKAWKEKFGVPAETFFVPDGVYEQFQDKIGKRGKALRGAWRRSSSSTSRLPRRGQADRPDGAARAARRVGQGPARLPGRPQGDGRPEGVGQGHQRRRQDDPLADRRARPTSTSRPSPDTPSPRRGELRAGHLRRPELPLRHPRARDGGVPQRDVADQGPPVRLGLLHLQRLRPAGDPDLGDHGDPDDPRLHPRLDRRRRGRPDPPADRAAGQPPRHPGPARDPPRRRQRGHRGLAGRSCA